MFVAHRPHRPDHRTKSSELHRRREMDHLVRTLFVSDSRVTRREVCKFGILQIRLDDALDRETSVVESECRLEWPLPVQETMTGKVYPFVLTELVGDPGNARVPSFDAREHRETIDALTNVGQFGTDGGEFTRADNVRLTGGDEVLPFTCRIR